MSEFQHYIDPPPQRKDIPEHPLVKLGRRFIFNLRKREPAYIMDEGYLWANKRRQKRIGAKPQDD